MPFCPLLPSSRLRLRAFGLPRVFSPTLPSPQPSSLLLPRQSWPTFPPRLLPRRCVLSPPPRPPFASPRPLASPLPLLSLRLPPSPRLPRLLSSPSLPPLSPWLLPRLSSSRLLPPPSPSLLPLPPSSPPPYPYPKPPAPCFFASSTSLSSRAPLFLSPPLPLPSSPLPPPPPLPPLPSPLVSSPLLPLSLSFPRFAPSLSFVPRLRFRPRLPLLFPRLFSRCRSTLSRCVFARSC